MTKKRSDQEHLEQSAFFEWRDTMLKQIPDLARIYANPNGGERNSIVGAKMKREGVSKGMLDITWPLPRGKYCGFYHELKVKYRNGRTNKPSTDQLSWIDYLNSVGYQASWSVGWESMQKAVLDYYDLGQSIYFVKGKSTTPLPANSLQSHRPHRGRYSDILLCLESAENPVNTSYISKNTGIKITSLHKTLTNMHKLEMIDFMTKSSSNRKLWFSASNKSD